MQALVASFQRISMRHAENHQNTSMKIIFPTLISYKILREIIFVKVFSWLSACPVEMATRGRNLVGLAIPHSRTNGPVSKEHKG